MKSPIFAGATDTGRRRDHNEDAFAIAAGLGIAVLADGMGGHAAGEVASELAVGTALTILGQTAGLGIRDRLETAVQAANANIRDKAASSSRYRDMSEQWARVEYRPLQLRPNAWSHQATLTP